MSNRRIYQWDNVKGLLILLMVMGHFASYVMEDNASIRSFYMFVYIFHMPLFVFISGMFAQPTIETGDGIRRKVIAYLILTLFIKFALFAVRYAFGDIRSFSLKESWGIDWYVFVMAVFLIVTWYLRAMDRKVLLAFAFVTALFIGYDKGVGRDWSLSRIFVFYPYYLMGTMWKKGRYRLAAVDKQLIMRIVAGGILILAWLLVRLKIDAITPLEHLLLGYRPYANFMDNTQLGWLYRLLLYMAACFLGACIVLVVPSRESYLTILGRRSLQIYVLHRPLLYLLELAGYEKLLSMVWPSHWKILYMLTSILLTIVLSASVFEKPFIWFMDQFRSIE